MTIINKKEAFRVLLSVPRKATLNIAAKNSIFLLDSSDKYIIH